MYPDMWGCIKLVIDEFESINIASNITGINKRGIALAANKKRKTAGGYIWKIK